jgi:hypothetical protein
MSLHKFYGMGSWEAARLFEVCWVTAKQYMLAEASSTVRFKDEETAF